MAEAEKDSQSNSQEQQPEKEFSQEQYEILKRCSENTDMTEWDKWREKNRNEEILLNGADLRGANLKGVHLEDAKLTKVHLENAILCKAHLQRTNLSEAHLNDADLQDAILANANLQGANLEGAHLENANLNFALLRDAHLERAYLQRAKLKNVELSQAHLEGAVLAEAHLENAALPEAHMEGADFYGAYLENADLWEAHMEGANLSKAHLEGAMLLEAHLEGANLSKAHLEGAMLLEAHLEGANLQEAYLRRVNFSNAFLQGTNCRKAIVDGETLIWGCKINKRGIREKNYTDFAGAGLDSARIQPQIKQLLEYNIRKSNWSLWYTRLWSRNLFTKIISFPVVPIKYILVRPFWLVSDYGHSTMRILITFLLLTLAYAIVYFYYPSCVYIYDKEVPFSSFLHSVYFSVVTMTTLGFGDIAANPKSELGLVLLMSQVILGYGLLGALVTRFAVLFTAGGPAGEFTEKEQKK